MIKQETNIECRPTYVTCCDEPECKAEIWVGTTEASAFNLTFLAGWKIVREGPVEDRLTMTFCPRHSRIVKKSDPEETFVIKRPKRLQSPEDREDSHNGIRERQFVNGGPSTEIPYEYVEHPQHYGGADDPYECIKVVEAWELGFCLGSAVRYISRAGKKPGEDVLRDLKKARWYIDREIERRSK